MNSEQEKLYEQLGHTWRHFASWREKVLAGYLTVLAGLAFDRRVSARVARRRSTP